MYKRLFGAVIALVFMGAVAIAQGGPGGGGPPGGGGGGAPGGGGSSPSGGSSDTSNHGGSKSKVDVGKVVVFCVMAADVSIFMAVGAVDATEDRDLTIREAITAAGSGCPAFYILLAFVSDDNPAVYRVAWLAHQIRRSPLGMMNFMSCHRGMAADACASDNDRWALAMGEAYNTGRVPAWIEQEYRTKVGVGHRKKTKKIRHIKKVRRHRLTS